MSANGYTCTRVRGLAPWAPRAKTLVLLGQIDAVLVEYAEHLPLTARQVFYRLVAEHLYPKDQAGYERLCETLVRARRARRVPFTAIRDDGVRSEVPSYFSGTAGFWRAVRYTADTYRLDRLEGQPRALELWCEAAGMLPQLARVAEPYGVPVYSSGGFDSLTAKHDAAERMLDRPTTVLHVGDHDPSGVALYDCAADDIAAMVRDLGGDPGNVRFVRVAVVPEQIGRFALPEATAKTDDKRGGWQGGTVQAEALSPSVLAAEVRTAIEAELDLELLERVKGREAAERVEIGEDVRAMLGRDNGPDDEDQEGDEQEDAEP
jgi:hypothetical protein